MSINFLRMQKEFFRFRGELQNDSINGVNVDERQMCKDMLNKEMRRLIELKPPYFKTQFHIQAQPDILLDDSSDVPAVTGTKGLPVINDSEENLNLKNRYWMLSDNTYRFHLMSSTGTTYKLDMATQVTATTNTLWTAYKSMYPLPHNCGDIISIYHESSNSEATKISAGEMLKYNKTYSTSSVPDKYAMDAFTNKFNAYKFSQANITFTNGSNEISVGTTYDDYYDINDNILVDTATTAEYLHTLIGVQSSTAYLDREFEGDTGACTVYCNPREHTRYVSFYPYTDTLADMVVTAWLRPPDLEADADVSPFETDLTWAIIIGALNQDKLSRQFLTEYDLAWLTTVTDSLRHERYDEIPPHQSAVMGGRRSYRHNEVTWTG
jgi:hypothetical protein